MAKMNFNYRLELNCDVIQAQIEEKLSTLDEKNLTLEKVKSVILPLFNKRFVNVTMEPSISGDLLCH